MNARPSRTAVLLAAIALATALAYLPGLWGPFVFDDTPNLLANPFIHLAALDWSALRDAAFSNQSGIFYRPIASLSFALNYYAAGGFAAFPFKLTNLLIHLLNGGLVYLLARAICARLRDAGPEGSASPPSDLVPLVVAAIWLLHPLQLTSVLYVVQRMNSLAAMFTLAGLLMYLHGRLRVERGAGGGIAMMIAGVAGGTVLGVLCKENAALLPVYALVLELACFDRPALDRMRRLQVRLFFTAVLGLPALTALVYVAVNPDFILASYESRTFTLWERLLTQPRVLFYYLGLILFPTRHELGLYHDDFVTSTGLLEPATTALAIAGWTLIAALAVVFRRRAPALFLGVGWFLGGHLMESGVIALEMVHEHRNYLPLFGILFSGTYGLLHVFRRAAIDARISGVAVVLVALTLGFVTSSRAYNWSSTGLLLESLIRHHPEAPRSHGYYAEQIINNRGDIHKAYYHLQQFSRLKPDAIAGLAEMVRIANGMALADVPREPRPAGAGEASSVFEIPLVNHPEQLERLARLAGAELERRLQTFPVSGNTVKTLVDLQICLYRGTRACVDMAPDLLRWMELTLQNPRTGARFRAVLLMTTAKTYSWMGNVEQAVEYAEQSVRTLPRDVNLSLDLVKLHLQLQNYARGLEIIETLKRGNRIAGFRSNEIRELEARLNAGLSQPASGG